MEDVEKWRQTAVSWLDLQDLLLESVLECLPLHDYLRFAAVCRKWWSIKRDHRLCQSLAPPLMARFPPCLVPTERNLVFGLCCYFPFNLKLHSFDFQCLCIFLAYGWLVVDADCQPHSRPLFLLNPISGVQIQIFTISLNLYRVVGSL